MPQHRSPVLGFNHNMKHRGLVFHVQTEDSGVRNPHIFTHCFHGGVILKSRRLDYDADANEETVKSLMQSLHKAMMKELKKGILDEKIDDYLGSHPDLEPTHKKRGAPPDISTSIKTPLPESKAPSVNFNGPKASAKSSKIASPPPKQEAAQAKGKTPSARAKKESGLYSKVRKSAGTQSPPPTDILKPAGKRAKRNTAAKGAAPSQHTQKKTNVVISRPSVVVGGKKPRSKQESKQAAASPRKNHGIW